MTVSLYILVSSCRVRAHRVRKSPKDLAAWVLRHIYATLLSIVGSLISPDLPHRISVVVISGSCWFALFCEAERRSNALLEDKRYPEPETNLQYNDNILACTFKPTSQKALQAMSIIAILTTIISGAELAVKAGEVTISNILFNPAHGTLTKRFTPV